MASLDFTLAARRDVLDILTYLEDEGGLTAAATLSDAFAKFFEHVATHPLLYPQRSMLGPHVRIGVVRSYLVLYRYFLSTDRVTILRIFHARRNIGRDFMKLP